MKLRRMLGERGRGTVRILPLYPSLPGAPHGDPRRLAKQLGIGEEIDAIVHRGCE